MNNNVVQVWYTVPVCAEVDLDEGCVSRVVVIDENIKLDPDEGVTLQDYSAPASDEDAERAIQIAESGVWPSWDFGY